MICFRFRKATEGWDPGKRSNISYLASLANLRWTSSHWARNSQLLEVEAHTPLMIKQSLEVRIISNVRSVILSLSSLFVRNYDPVQVRPGLYGHN